MVIKTRSRKKARRLIDSLLPIKSRTPAAHIGKVSDLDQLTLRKTREKKKVHDRPPATSYLTP